MTAPVGAPDPTVPAPDALPVAGPSPTERVQPATAREIATAICPYLSSSAGAWRSASPSRNHRCLALTPPTAQTTVKQRQHCLVAAHVDCTIFAAAGAARQTALAAGADPARVAAADESRRPLPRTTPVLLEPPRLIDQAARLQLDRAPGQVALVALMVVAFAIVALSRLSGGGEPAPSANPSFVAAAPSLLAPTPSPTLVVEPSASGTGSAAPSGGPSPSFRTTYTVKKGDTLIGVAAKFKTTASAIRKLNGLTSSTLHTGQVLKIP